MYLFLSYMYVGVPILERSSTEEDDLEISLEENEVNNDSLYVPTPVKSLKKLNPIVILKRFL